MKPTHSPYNQRNNNSGKWNNPTTKGNAAETTGAETNTDRKDGNF